MQGEIQPMPGEIEPNTQMGTIPPRLPDMFKLVYLGPPLTPPPKGMPKLVHNVVETSPCKRAVEIRQEFLFV